MFGLYPSCFGCYSPQAEEASVLTRAAELHAAVAGRCPGGRVQPQDLLRLFPPQLRNQRPAQLLQALEPPVTQDAWAAVVLQAYRNEMQDDEFHQWLGWMELQAAEGAQGEQMDELAGRMASEVWVSQESAEEEAAQVIQAALRAGAVRRAIPGAQPLQLPAEVLQIIACFSSPGTLGMLSLVCRSLRRVCASPSTVLRTLARAHPSDCQLSLLLPSTASQALRCTLQNQRRIQALAAAPGLPLCPGPPLCDRDRLLLALQHTGAQLHVAVLPCGAGACPRGLWLDPADFGFGHPFESPEPASGLQGSALALKPFDWDGALVGTVPVRVALRSIVERWELPEGTPQSAALANSELLSGLEAWGFGFEPMAPGDAAVRIRKLLPGPEDAHQLLEPARPAVTRHSAHPRCLKTAYDHCLTAQQLVSSPRPGSHLRAALHGGVLQFKRASSFRKLQMAPGSVQLFVEAPEALQGDFPELLALRALPGAWLGPLGPVSVLRPDGAQQDWCCQELLGSLECGAEQQPLGSGSIEGAKFMLAADTSRDPSGRPVCSMLLARELSQTACSYELTKVYFWS